MHTWYAANDLLDSCYSIWKQFFKPHNTIDAVLALDIIAPHDEGLVM
jgi:hypothetical protein